ncbi:MAG: hypothetical protein M0Z60_05925 [Nitrospiraceae bacterium]|nr:hypothetical protein [Nitrospiraceae bacterium]
MINRREGTTDIRDLQAPGGTQSGRSAEKITSGARRGLFSRAVFLMVSAFLLFSCSSAPSPSDAKLIEKFRANETALNNLASSPDNPELRKLLGIKGMHIRSSDPKVILFAFWSKDYVGPGGSSKGIAYSTKEPQNLLDHLDGNPAAGPSNKGVFYMHIGGPWYVYFESHD